MLAYRPEIDGLRSLAVFAVIFFHLKFEINDVFLVKGGFIGVDIFFVISGYLICSIIFRGLDNNTFSLLDFYSRRIKRIFPALILVLFASTIAAAVFLIPNEFTELQTQIIGSAGFFVNVVFLSDLGYFDTVADTKPLLHLWSLSIEEQFYLVIPLVIVLIWNWKKNYLFGVLLVLFLFSLQLSHAGSKLFPDANFYLLPFRGWELLAGALLAKQEFYSGRVSSPLLDRCMPPIGMFLVINALIFTPIGEAHPSYLTLMPIVGVMLLIWFMKDGEIISDIMRSRILVVGGLISYPLYLWHWPIFSYAYIIQGELPSSKVRIGILVVSILLAWITYKFIELPVRRRGNRLAIPLMGLMVLIGAGGYNLSQEWIIYPSNTPDETSISGDIGNDNFFNYMSDNFFTCKPIAIWNFLPKWEGKVRCKQSKNDRPVDIAIIGDSHAEHAFLGLAEELSNKNIAYYIIGNPFDGNEEFKEITRYVLGEKSIEKVILSTAWGTVQRTVPTNSTFQSEMYKFANKFEGVVKKLYILEDGPLFSFLPRRCLVDSSLCKESSKSNDEIYSAYMPTLEQIDKQHINISILRLYKEFCRNGKCSMVSNGKLLFRDQGHFSILGSKYAAKKLINLYPELNE